MLLARKMLMMGDAGVEVDLTAHTDSHGSHSDLWSGMFTGLLETGSSCDITVSVTDGSYSFTVEDCVIFVWDKDDGDETARTPSIWFHSDSHISYPGSLSVTPETMEYAFALPDGEPVFAIGRQNASVTDTTWVGGDFQTTVVKRADNVSGTPRGATAADCGTLSHEGGELLEMDIRWGDAAGEAVGSMIHMSHAGTAPTRAYRGSVVVTNSQTGTAAEFVASNFSVGAGFTDRVFVVGVALGFSGSAPPSPTVTVNMKGV